MDGSDKKRSEQQRQGQEQAQEQLLRLRRSTHTARNPRPTIRGRGQDEGFTHPSIRGRGQDEGFTHPSIRKLGFGKCHCVDASIIETVDETLTLALLEHGIHQHGSKALILILDDRPTFMTLGLW
jgi:hypothetical protein